MRRFLFLLAVVLLWCPEVTAEDARSGELAFTLRDYRGKEHSWSDYDQHDFLVVAMMGTECPLAKLYAPRLESLWQEYRERGVMFLGVNANLQDTITEIAAYARIHKITFPVLKDPDHGVADQLGAERTPQVLVFDQQRRVRYAGRVDDQYGVGYIREEPKRDDLRIALDELLAGKPVSVAKTPGVGCLLGRRPRVEPSGDVTYTRQIARLLQRRCVSCHRDGEIAPFPLTSYEDASGWSAMMWEVIQEGRMPPWNASPEHGHFANDARMSDAEKQLLRKWIDNGCPEGDPEDLPPPLEFTPGWRISEPDQVIKMRDEPFAVPAEGAVAYQYFTVDPGFQEDKWVIQAEARPENRSVVHHILVFIRHPEVRGYDVLVGFAPGTPPRNYPQGVARRIPAGAKLVFQLHYTPNGSPQTDLSEIGLVFTDPRKVEREASGGMAINRRFEIPPGAADHRVTSRYEFRRDEWLLSMSPHMHLRGKAFRFEARYPDGRQEVLLDVPRYDFNWQLRYDLAEPKKMPKGTRLVCTGVFDNSEDNLSNPDPAQAVRWGDQTWEEMMIGWFMSMVDK